MIKIGVRQTQPVVKTDLNESASLGTVNRDRNYSPPVYRSISPKWPSWTTESPVTTTASVLNTFRSNQDNCRKNSSWSQVGWTGNDASVTTTQSNSTQMIVDRGEVWQCTLGWRVQSDLATSLSMSAREPNCLANGEGSKRIWAPKNVYDVSGILYVRFWDAFSRILVREACCSIWFSLRTLKAPKWNRHLDLTSTFSLSHVVPLMLASDKSIEVHIFLSSRFRRTEIRKQKTEVFRWALLRRCPRRSGSSGAFDSEVWRTSGGTSLSLLVVTHSARCNEGLGPSCPAQPPIQDGICSIFVTHWNDVRCCCRAQQLIRWTIRVLSQGLWFFIGNSASHWPVADLFVYSFFSTELSTETD